MAEMFDEKKPDFSGILSNSSDNIYISKVIQKAIALKLMKKEP